MSLNAKVRETNDRTELGDMVPDQRFDPEASALETSLCRDLSAAMAQRLSEREQRFLRAYFGFDTGQPATLEEVGATEGLTRERARQVIADALRKLRDDPVVAGHRREPADWARRRAMLRWSDAASHPERPAEADPHPPPKLPSACPCLARLDGRRGRGS